MLFPSVCFYLSGNYLTMTFDIIPHKTAFYSINMRSVSEKLYNNTENQQVEAPDEKNAETKNEATAIAQSDSMSRVQVGVDVQITEN